MNLIYHPRMLEHYVPDDCPEQPGRLEALLAVPWLSARIASALQGNYRDDQESVHRALNGEPYLKLFHTPRYIQQIKEESSHLGEREFTTIDQERETWLSARSYEAACYAVGASVQAAELARKGENSFALTRPPGHHAFPDKSHGFCLFNNVAIATEHLRRQGERVMIIDLDLHLGDGTLAYVESKEDVFYFSFHQEEEWPRTRFTSKSKGNTRLVYLPEGTTEDTYISVLREYLPADLRRFHPSLIAVSAGFDTYKTDHDQPLLRETMGGFMLTSQSTRELINIINEGGKPYFAVLEGGYTAESVLAGVLSFVGIFSAL